MILVARKTYDPEYERELFIKAKQGDLQARKKIHKEYKNTLDSIVYKHYRNNPQPFWAIRAEAEDLLDKFIDSWDPSMKNKPNTYIYGNIEKKLMRYVNERDKPVRVPEQYSFKLNKFRDSVSELSQELQRKPTIPEIKNHMNKKFPEYKLSTKDVERLQRDLRTTVLASSTVGSLDEGTPVSMGDIAFSTNENPMEAYKRDTMVQEALEKAKRLPEPQRTIFYHTYGLEGYQQLSLRQLALKLGLKKYRVQKYLQEALNTIKNG